MILLTGASGFIGKPLMQALIGKYGIKNIVALTSKPIGGIQYILHHNYLFEEDYLINQGYANIECIIHAGAFIPKSGKEINDINLCNSNISNTVCLLNSRLPNLKKVIYLSTVDVYSDHEIITESSKTSPVSLYGDSKLYCEKMISAWCKTNGALSQILRIGHVYGPGEEKFKKVIPVTIRKILDNEPVEIYGTGSNIRSFIFINDVVKAVINSLNLTTEVGPINVVSSNHITIKNLIKKIITISNTYPKIIELEAIGQSRNLIFDNTKMKTHLLNLEKGLDNGLTEEWLSMKASRL